MEISVSFKEFIRVYLSQKRSIVELPGTEEIARFSDSVEILWEGLGIRKMEIALEYNGFVNLTTNEIVAIDEHIKQVNSALLRYGVNHVK